MGWDLALIILSMVDQKGPYYISQGSVTTCLSCCGIFSSACYKHTAKSDGEDFKSDGDHFKN